LWVETMEKTICPAGVEELSWSIAFSCNTGAAEHTSKG
jgi:hypothetical protein